MISLTLTNTHTKKKESFKPQRTDSTSLYVCGITPYDLAHLGHGRCYVAFDLLFRLLKFLEYKVTYVRNYTDIDDKLIHKATALGKPYLEVANEYISAYKKNMTQLNCLSPDVEPRVTEHIQEIISFIQGLIANDKAYVVNHDVYFDISSFKEYGKLSKRKLDEQEMGARIEINSEKKNPGDFALWKGSANQQFWKSPWGYGRPGWHIECSAMAKKYFGETIDIHGGGADLVFPHHENEVAQSEGLHDKSFVNYWLHNAFVNINKEKMSKSLGNSVTLNAIFEKHDPIVLRYFFMQHHYRTPIDFNLDELNNVSTAYKRLVSTFQDAQTETFTINKIDTYSPIVRKVLEALCDDLNSTKALGIIFHHLDEIKQSQQLKNHIYFIITSILGLPLKPIKEHAIMITPEAKALIDEREEARKNKDWERADQIRDKLVSMGIPLHDKKV